MSVVVVGFNESRKKRIKTKTKSWHNNCSITVVEVYIMKKSKILVFVMALALILHGKVSIEIIICSYIAGVLVTYFNKKLVKKEEEPLKLGIKNIGVWIRYITTLIYQIIVANFQVAYIVLNPKLEIEPQIIEYKTKIKNGRLKAILANSITLTPGTITVDIKEDVLKIHCLKEKFAKEVFENQFEKLLLTIESN